MPKLRETARGAATNKSERLVFIWASIGYLSDTHLFWKLALGDNVRCSRSLLDWKRQKTVDLPSMSHTITLTRILSMSIPVIDVDLNASFS